MKCVAYKEIPGFIMKCPDCRYYYENKCFKCDEIHKCCFQHIDPITDKSPRIIIDEDINKDGFPFWCVFKTKYENIENND